MSESTVVSTIIDDRDPSILYLPDTSDWTVHTQVGAQYQLHGDSDTFSDHQGASIQFTFFGDAIEYWGNQGPAHGPCIVNLDGADQQTINSNAIKDDVPISLFKKEGLKKDTHTIKITVANASPPNVCELDRFIISNTTIVGGNRPTSTLVITSTLTHSSASDTATAASSNNKNGSSDPPWAIIGGAAGGAVLLILILLGLWCWLSSNKKKKRARNVHSPRNVRATHTRTRSSIHRDEKPAIPPPTLANNVEKAGFNYGVGDGVPPTMHPQGPPQGPPQGYPPPLSPPHQHQQLFNQFGQPVAAHPTHPMNSGLSIHSGRVSSPSHSRGPSRTSTSTYVPSHVRPLSQASSGFEYYQQPHQQLLQHPQEYTPHQPQEYPQHHPQEYPQHHPQEYPQHHPQHPQQYPQQYPEQHPEQHPEQNPQQPSQQHPQYHHPPQPAVLPVWASGETLAGTGFTPVVAGGTPAPVQRTATLPTPAPGVTDSSPGFAHEKAVYSRNVQPESTPGSGGSNTPGGDLMGEGSGSRAPPEAPPPAYNAYDP